jgi:hypothetical protein
MTYSSINVALKDRRKVDFWNFVKKVRCIWHIKTIGNKIIENINTQLLERVFYNPWQNACYSPKPFCKVAFMSSSGGLWETKLPFSHIKNRVLIAVIHCLFCDP